MKQQYKSIVMTSGISLFAGPNTYGKYTRERQLLHFERSNPLLPEGLSEHEAEKLWLSAMQELKRDDQQSPQHVSAEYSLLHALHQQKQLSSQPVISLFHTETLGGRLAALWLQYLFQEDFDADVKLCPLQELNVNNRQQLNQALARFMHKLTRELEAKEPLSTCFAPIGGYKVMTSFGYIAAAIHGYASAYLHEDQQILHQIPPMPFALPTFPAAHRPLLKRLVSEDILARDVLTETEKEIVAVYENLLERDTDLIALNALGRYLLERPESGLLEPLFWVSEKVAGLLRKDPGAEIFVKQQLKELWQKYCQFARDHVSHRAELFHEKVYSQSSKFNFSLYKGASNGQYPFRAAWCFNEQRKALQINWIGLDHDKYEREVEGHLRQAYGGLHPL